MIMLRLLHTKGLGIKDQNLTDSETNGEQQFLQYAVDIFVIIIIKQQLILNPLTFCSETIERLR